MDENDRPIHAATSDAGMNRLARDGFEPALLSLVDPWLGSGTTDVLACGMVGAQQGWAPAAYMPVPCAPVGPGVTRAPAVDTRLSVRILPGICQPDPPDVMRGEETQIAGVLAVTPGFDGVICLPGSHTKWAEVSAGEIVSFRTFMTGELFAALRAHTVLRHTVPDEGWDDAAFLEAVGDTLSRPESLAARFFALRAASLLEDLPGPVARARLSGALVGAELAASRPYWLGQRLALVGSDGAAAGYAAALKAQGAAPMVAEAETATLAGLVAARKALS